MHARRSGDLIDRIVRTLEFAREAVTAILSDSWSSEFTLPREKFVAETALLLYTIAPVASLHELIRAHVRAIAAKIAPVARSDEVCGAICLDPGQALDHACAHILLTAIGCCHEGVDRLLRASLDVDMAPERLPHRLLEQRWLRTLVNRGGSPYDASLIAGSMLARPLDALSSSRYDFYGFTHAVMYASDFGASPPSLTSGAVASANAVTGLAFAVSELDYDLAAELLMTWPMLDIAWPSAAATAFEWLAQTEDVRGFLPGMSFSGSSYATLRGRRRKAHLFATCYHTMYVMGFLCASMLRFDRAPPSPTGDDRKTKLLTVAEPRLSGDQSAVLIMTLDDREQLEALGPLLITIALRDAARAGDVPALRARLQLALDRDLIDNLAVRQAVDFLRCTPLLEGIHHGHA